MDNKKGLLISICLLLVVIAVVAIYILNDTDDTIFVEEENEKTKITESLLSNKIFQDSVGLGSNYSSLYYFKEDGTFIYTDTLVTKEGEVLRALGTWSIKNNTLTLIITEQQVAVGGTVTEDTVLGEYLTDYTVNIINDEQEETYNLKIVEEEGINYIGGDITLYEVTLTEEEMKLYFE